MVLLMANYEDFFNRLQDELDKSTEGIKKSITRRAAGSIARELQDEERIRVAMSENKVTVKEEPDPRGDGPIDMKPFYRRSSKANRTEKGGWYLTIPIRLYTPSKNADNQRKANRMTQKLYKDLLSQGANRELVSDYLYEKRQVSPIPELNYTPVSDNVTRLKNPRGRGSIYVAFRTVSDKSPPNSWIINRENARPDNLSNRIKRIIRQVKRGQG